MISYRLINKEDFIGYHKLQNENSRIAPHAFYESPNEKPSIELIKNVLQNLSDDKFRFGAFDGIELIGLIGFNRFRLKKLNHKGELFGFFVYPEYQNKGIGSELFKASVQKATKIDGLEVINTTVLSNCKASLHICKKLGFYEYGYENDSMKIDNLYIDEIYLRKQLNSIAPRLTF